MMLPGKLTHTTLGDLLGQCHRARASGALTLLEPQGRSHRVHLRSGQVTAVELDRASPSLGDLLRETEHAPDESILRRSLLRSLSSARLHGEVLVQDFAVSPSVVQLALRRQIRVRLAALDALKEADVRFHVTEPAPRHALADAPLDGPEFLPGRRRARERLGGPPEGSERHARRVLGLGGAAGEREIKLAYRRLVRALHPDLNPDVPPGERSGARGPLRRSDRGLPAAHGFLKLASSASKSLRAASTLFSGPVILKKNGRSGVCTIAASSS